MNRLTRATATIRRLRQVGPRGLAQRVAARAYRATDARDLTFHLDVADVARAVPATLATPEPVPGNRPLTVGWVTSPPAAGSGGHTTLFRMVEGLEARGHRCVVLLYDRHGLDVAQRTAELRAGWPGVRAEVRDAREGFAGLDAVVASSWESAHVMLAYDDTPTHRLYFIQDYEPYFYPRGSEYELAAMTYRFPFRRIALGDMVAGCLRSELGQDSDLVPFGCDTATYRLPEPAVPRSGVVLYAKPDVGRRGYLLAVLALERFHREHPDQPIHVYGSRPTDLPFPVTYHGRLTPDGLNALYGTAVAGLAMSFTNISLVAEEMLAAGVVPVVNDSPLARADLPNPYVAWAEPTAEGIAARLSSAVTHADVAGQAEKAAASVTGRSWELTQRQVARIVEDEVRGRSQG
ncbi:glycosyltransferase family 1 protein [Promicromonospora thailandica]|uniref:Glycosyl transferases group 1 n=1 Tax=Promicromonospora thailandica TaxID=765201 RepID=A0A9X2JUV3_9MICO|nr:glycosyltransferase family 1 protein [Promicromonospora thailandica]MCP2264900.1 Glycosyl transferases group 1 [Promicromonospora thailandica]BFF18831.1 glycosyltransferase family 1 protein [Promicromonospora thailandica]